ncbi:MULTISPECIES: MoaD/ThiS family protein [Tenacibaculum]|uniref:MoaD/ThiS family protein n=1 Tax=Tenacibaculum TaxID=104267 RepID=UPI001F0ABE7A|nr:MULTISPECIES: MoaD/ThiS family protein [Tenacibaculum]MCH3881090.1 MoaD/ThiS family protein [Tenacibaculum aquimarinum]MCH3884045.1 MoaD/ThiS family protein [Tenacibaculum aquimarinum]MDO6599310.1 MoaD/ThiS family protein [Tenacibaculum sp. 1_MG-2023]
MKIKILLFGITSDLLETSSLDFEVDTNSSVADLKSALLVKYPQLKNINSYAIAVNESYADSTLILQENDVIAIIPPVSGG